MENLIKFNSELDKLSPIEVCAFHLDNFFTIPENLKNVIISSRMNCDTSPQTLKILISNLILTYGEETVLKAINSCSSKKEIHKFIKNPKVS